MLKLKYMSPGLRTPASPKPLKIKDIADFSARQYIR